MPVAFPRDAQHHLLILDLDETLIHATEIPVGRSADFHIGPYHVYRRPHLAVFLRNMSEHFQLAIWTSSTADYAQRVVRQIKPNEINFAFVWTRERCIPRRNFSTGTYDWIKDLKKVKRKGYDLDHVIVVDDSPEKLQRHYGNLVRVRPYMGEQDDDELTLLMQYLPRLKHILNVRTVEKRGWRTSITTFDK